MLFLMIFTIFFISLILMYINMLISKKKSLDREKLSTFECGFTPFSSSRLPFSINFFIIGILFLIFDVEVIFLFPMIKLLKLLMFYEFLFMSLFIMMILYLGLEFEKNEGSLKWNF